MLELWFLNNKLIYTQAAHTQVLKMAKMRQFNARLAVTYRIIITLERRDKSEQSAFGLVTTLLRLASFF